MRKTDGHDFKSSFCTVVQYQTKQFVQQDNDLKKIQKSNNHPEFGRLNLKPTRTLADYTSAQANQMGLRWELSMQHVPMK